jgi:hypothetical protein
MRSLRPGSQKGGPGLKGWGSVGADIEEAMWDVDKTAREDAWRKQRGCVRQLSDRLNLEGRRDSLNEGRKT